MDAAEQVKLSNVIDQEINRRMAEKRKDSIATLRELAVDCRLSVEELCVWPVAGSPGPPCPRNFAIRRFVA